MSLTRGTVVCLACALWAGPAGAQLAGTLDLGAGSYRPDRAIPGGIASIAPALRFHNGPLELSALGVYSDAPAGRWNFQGATEALARTPALGVLQLEATGRAEWTSHYRVRGTTMLSGGVRASLATASGARAWIGRSFGQATTLGARRPLRRSEIGGAATVGAVYLRFTLANTTVDRSFMLGAVDPRESVDSFSASPSPAGERTVDRIALTDAVLAARWTLESFDLEAALGRRFSRSTPETTIWGASVSRDVAPGLALVAAAGRAGSDPVTSVPGARYFALGLRLKVGPVAGPLLPAVERAPETAAFRIGPPVAAGREIVVRAPDAHSVEIAGDFTDWKPVALRPWGEDAWRALLPVPPGLRRLAVRIDGGEWQAPPGTRAVRSEFGGEVAEVVVE